MRNSLLAGAAALALVAFPAALNAQAGPQPGARSDTPPTSQSTARPNAQQGAQATGQTAPRTSAQANARPVPPATTTVSTTPAGRTVITSNNPGNLAPPPPSALDKTYPPCTRTLQDNCQNPGER